MYLVQHQHTQLFPAFKQNKTNEQKKKKGEFWGELEGKQYELFQKKSRN